MSEMGMFGTIVKTGITSRVLTGLSVIFLFLMMAFTFSDMIGRYFFNSRITGETEIISFLLGLTIFSAFPLVTYNRNHIVAGLFEQFFHGRVRFHLFKHERCLRICAVFCRPRRGGFND